MSNRKTITIPKEHFTTLNAWASSMTMEQASDASGIPVTSLYYILNMKRTGQVNKDKIYKIINEERKKKGLEEVSIELI